MSCPNWPSHVDTRASLQDRGRGAGELKLPNTVKRLPFRSPAGTPSMDPFLTSLAPAGKLPAMAMLAAVGRTRLKPPNRSHFEHFGLPA